MRHFTGRAALCLIPLLLAGCADLSGKLVHDRHHLSRLYPADAGNELIFEASTSVEYPEDSAAAEAVRQEWIAQWLKQRALCAGGYEVIDRVTITDAADNPYWHDLRYRLRCR